MLVPIILLCFLTRMTDSSCSTPGSDPGFSSDFQPAVTRVSSTSVMVQWTKSHVENLDCGDNFIVKYWPTGEPARYKVSPLLPLKVYENVNTKSFGYTKNNETFMYLARGLDSHISHTIQVVVTEDRAVMGRSWYRSLPSDVPAMQYTSVKAKEEDIDAMVLILAEVMAVLAVILILVGSFYNIRKWIIRRKRDYDSESDQDFDDLEGMEVEMEPQIRFNQNGDIIFPEEEVNDPEKIDLGTEENVVDTGDKLNIRPKDLDLGSELPFKEIDPNRQVTANDYRNAMAAVYLLKNGKYIKKSATRSRQSKPGGQSTNSKGQAGRGGLAKKGAASKFQRKDIKLAANKDRMVGARKGVLACRNMRKPAARLVAQGVILSNI